MTTLIRLYYQEGEYTQGWWGTRPDTTGPYFDRKPWAASESIAKALQTAFPQADKATAEHIITQLARHKVTVAGLPNSVATRPEAEPEVAIKLPQVDPDNKDLIANMPFDVASARALKTAGDAKRGSKLFVVQQCSNCHTNANGQTPRGPHLVDIGKRYKRAELIESILQPSTKIAQGFDTYSFATVDGLVISGFVVSESADTVQIRQDSGLSKELSVEYIELRKKQEQSMMPNGLADNLTPEQLSDLLAYLESLR